MKVNSYFVYICPVLKLSKLSSLLCGSGIYFQVHYPPLLWAGQYKGKDTEVQSSSFCHLFYQLTLVQSTLIFLCS